MIARLTKRFGSERGQALVEFALLLPLLLLLLSGILDFGRMMFTYMNLNLCSEEAIRLGGLGKDDASIEQFAYNYLNISDPSTVQISITPPDSTRKSGDYVTITMTEPFHYITPLLSSVLPASPEVKTTATIRVE